MRLARLRRDLSMITPGLTITQVNEYLEFLGDETSNA